MTAHTTPEHKSFAEMLAGNDLRSVGASNAVAAKVHSQAHFDALFACTLHPNRTIAMRSMDAVEKICREQPHYLQPHQAQLLPLVEAAAYKELKWHLAQLMPRLQWQQEPLGRIWHLLSAWALDPSESRIVRVNAVQALFELLPQAPELKADLQYTIARVKAVPFPSMTARLRRLEKLI